MNIYRVAALTLASIAALSSFGPNSNTHAVSDSQYMAEAQQAVRDSAGIADVPLMSVAAMHSISDCTVLPGGVTVGCVPRYDASLYASEDEARADQASLALMRRAER